MGRSRKRATLTLPPELINEIDEYSEEQHIDSRSKTVELLARDALERRREGEAEDDEGGGGGLGISDIFGLTAWFGSAFGPALVGLALLLVLTVGQGRGVVSTVALALSEGLILSGVLLFVAALVALFVGWRDDRTAEDTTAPTEEGADA
jgi:hypothetical protein